MKLLSKNTVKAKCDLDKSKVLVLQKLDQDRMLVTLGDQLAVFDAKKIKGCFNSEEDLVINDAGDAFLIEFTINNAIIILNETKAQFHVDSKSAARLWEFANPN